MIIQTARPTCYRANSLPHSLNGQVTIGTIDPLQVITVTFLGYSLAAPKNYTATSDENGLISITIPENDKFWFTAFEECGYKIQVLDSDNSTIPFTVGETEVECVIVNLQINCEDSAPYTLSLVDFVETDNSCNTCQ